MTNRRIGIICAALKLENNLEKGKPTYEIDTLQDDPDVGPGRQPG